MPLELLGIVSQQESEEVVVGKGRKLQRSE
jgi:hypothetical protein